MLFGDGSNDFLTQAQTIDYLPIRAKIKSDRQKMHSINHSAFLYLF